jgi:hypothetical protein
MRVFNMNDFDSEFENEINQEFINTFGKTIILEGIGEFKAIFNANQQNDSLNGSPLAKFRYSIEFNSKLITDLPIIKDSIFIIKGKRYKYEAKPFIDTTGWATLPLTLTSN